MRQRIKVAQAILHDPQVLVLDEPLNGLDPVGRREITDLMGQLAAEGRCVLVSSHILYEVEQLTDSILLMQRGRLLARGSVQSIREELDNDTQTPRHIRIRVDQPRPLAAALLPLPSVSGVRFDPADAGRLEVETHDPRSFFAALPDVMLAGDYAIESMDSPDDHLESLVRNLLSRN